MKRIPQLEFIALMGFLWSALAFAIDSILPALSTMAADLGIENANQTHLVVTLFIFGMGLGILIFGPLSDRFGRKPAVIVGLGIYGVSALIAMSSEDLTVILICRIAQGFGAAAPRVVTSAIIRDLYVGRDMARITSFVMMVFLAVPAVSPALGQAIMNLVGWRMIFASFALFAIVGSLWLGLRLPETLDTEHRRPFSAKAIWEGTKEALSHAQFTRSLVILTLTLTFFTSIITTIQPVYDIMFDKADSFPAWFASTAVITMSSAFFNSRIVYRFGIRKIARIAYPALAIVTALTLVLLLWGALSQPQLFALYYIWCGCVFFMAGITTGNLTALALEPLGHLAGLGSSILQGLATIGSSFLSILITSQFDGTFLANAVGILLCASAASLLARKL